jgi:hypothetical protein
VDVTAIKGTCVKTRSRSGTVRSTAPEPAHRPGARGGSTASGIDRSSPSGRERASEGAPNGGARVTSINPIEIDVDGCRVPPSSPPVF